MATLLYGNPVTFLGSAVGWDIDATAPTGLRERKKEKTRAQLTSIALRLFDERGFDDVTVEDIVRAAEVSPRTFYRYFPSKEDVLFGPDHERIEEFASVLRARPADEPILESLRTALVQSNENDHHAAADRQRRSRILRTSPSLRMRMNERRAAWESVAIPIVADRLGTDPDDDLTPRLMVACAISAIRVAADVWVAGGSRGELAPLVDAALARLVAGFDDHA